MNALIPTVIGVFVSLLTFGITYWKTDGARKEREKNVRKDMVSILARAFGSGSGHMSPQVVESLLRSKCRECNINLNSFEEFPRITDDLVAKFTENDFIPADIRAKLIESAFELHSSFVKEKTKLENVVKEQEREPERKAVSNVLASAFFAAVTAAITFVAFALFSRNLAGELLTYASSIVAMVGISVGIISILLASRENRIKRQRSVFVGEVLENIVQKELMEIVSPQNLTRNVKSSDGSRYVEIDFLVNTSDEVLPIEVKSVPISSQVVDQMTVAMKGTGAKRGILVTSSSDTPDAIRKLASDKKVHIIETSSSEMKLAQLLRKAVTGNSLP